MLSVPLTGTPALIAVVVGLGGVFIALSQMTRHSMLRILLLVTAFGAIAAGGALGLRDEAAALALGGKLFLGGVVLVCVGALLLLGLLHQLLDGLHLAVVGLVFILVRVGALLLLGLFHEVLGFLLQDE